MIGARCSFSINWGGESAFEWYIIQGFDDKMIKIDTLNEKENYYLKFLVIN